MVEHVAQREHCAELSLRYARAFGMLSGIVDSIALAAALGNGEGLARNIERAVTFLEDWRANQDERPSFARLHSEEAH
jgi:hypothetical protein